MCNNMCNRVDFCSCSNAVASVPVLLFFLHDQINNNSNDSINNNNNNNNTRKASP